MKLSGIYKIQSKIKPYKYYIGSSIDINNRWTEHLKKLRKNKHHSKKLQNHYNKYGESDLCFSFILGCDIEDLIKIEQFFIDLYKPFFNVCPFAGNTLGRFHSEETKEKISKSKKGIVTYKITEIHKQKLSKLYKNKPLPEEIKQKMREGWEKRRIRLGNNKSKYLIKKYGT